MADREPGEFARFYGRHDHAAMASGDPAKTVSRRGDQRVVPQDLGGRIGEGGCASVKPRLARNRLARRLVELPLALVLDQGLEQEASAKFYRVAFRPR